MKNIFLVAALFIVGAFILVSFTSNSLNQDPWVVPAEYEKMSNPIEKGDKAALKMGRKLYNKHCKSCHGKEGLGDGSKAAQLDTPCGDLSSEEYKAQSDGAKFYKSWIGRDEMPNYEKKIPDEEDIWSIILYMDEF